MGKKFFRRLFSGTKADKANGFSWSDIGRIDPLVVEKFRTATSEEARKIPLAVANQVFDRIENELASPGKMDAIEMAQRRGGLMALKEFAKLWLYAFGETGK